MIFRLLVRKNKTYEDVNLESEKPGRVICAVGYG